MDVGGGAGEPRASELEGDVRRRVLDVAYRMLGSLAEAEDVVQEVALRWHALDAAERDAIRSPVAWCTTVASRLCLDQLGSARHRRERYVGTWLPEPLPGGGGWSSGAADEGAGDPAELVTLDESVSMAMLVVLEALTPAERVAFVLHDVFGLAFGEVAAVLDRSPGACRQLASSARQRLRSRPAEVPAPGSNDEVLGAFRAAWRRGDVDALVQVLDPSVVATVDGGGRVSAPVEPVVGADEVARLLVDVAARHPDLELVAEVVNGRPGIVARSGPAALAVLSAAVEHGRVHQLWVVRNPDKLRPWGPPPG